MAEKENQDGKDGEVFEHKKWVWGKDKGKSDSGEW